LAIAQVYNLLIPWNGFSYACRVRIRPAQAADAPALARLSGQLGYPAAAEELAARLRALDGSPDHAVLVAEDGAVAGWLHVCRRLTLEKDFAEITGLIVDEARRSAGVGLLLLKAAEDWAKAEGLKVVRVRSNVVRARAHAFYVTHGYALSKRQAVLDKTLA
jgi:N-acetylglutamate synthase-like GNAT family acetyltransferase